MGEKGDRKKGLQVGALSTFSLARSLGPCTPGSLAAALAPRGLLGYPSVLLLLSAPVSDLFAKLQGSLVTARKAQDKERTLVLSTLVAQVKDAGLKIDHPIGDADVVDVLRKGLKTRQDSIEQFEKAGRTELAEREKAQSKVIAEFLPASIDPAEVKAAAKAAVASGAKDIGALMKVLMPQFKGRADGKVINEAAREALQAG